MSTTIETDIEELYYSIIDALAIIKTMDEQLIKEYNDKATKVNSELRYLGYKSEILPIRDWFNATVHLTRVRNNVIELYRLLKKKTV